MVISKSISVVGTSLTASNAPSHIVKSAPPLCLSQPVLFKFLLALGNKSNQREEERETEGRREGWSQRNEKVSWGEDWSKKGIGMLVY